VAQPWASEEGTGEPWPPKVVFSILRGKKQISPLLAPLEKNLGKSPPGPLLEKILPTPVGAARMRP